jgi:putative transposase
VRGLGGVALAIGGVADHVHLLVSLKTTIAPAEFVRELKKASSVWAADKHERQFAWQEGYGIFSVSGTHVEAVRDYIANQEEHHKRTPHRAEMERLLSRNGVQFDPRFLE